MLLMVLAVMGVVAVGFLVVPKLFQRNEPVADEYPAGE
jgi:hypothetical protein